MVNGWPDTIHAVFNNRYYYRNMMNRVLYTALRTAFEKKAIKVLIFCSVVQPLFATAAEKTVYTVVVTNTQPFRRTNEVVHLSRKWFGNIGNLLHPIVQSGTKVLTSQLVDEDLNGSWDALLVEVTLLPLATDTLQIIWQDSAHQAVPPPASTSVRLSLKTKSMAPGPEIKREVRTRGFVQNIADPYYQMEGPGIENDKVAFRAFFDYRNGKDVYGKVTDTPILKQVGVSGSWHTLQPWGMDILKVGSSLGAGALAVQENHRLYRLADADTSVFTVLYQGALAAAFRLQFTRWDVGTRHANGSETISVTKGDFFYKNEITVPLRPEQYLVAGMANFITDSGVFTRHHPVFSSVSTYGKQAEGTASRLGLAILFSAGSYVESKTSLPGDSISNTSYVVLKPVRKRPAVIYFIACWEKTDPRFSTQQGFDTYVREAANRLAHPLQVKFIKPKKNQSS